MKNRSSIKNYFNVKYDIAFNVLLPLLPPRTKIVDYSTKIGIGVSLYHPGNFFKTCQVSMALLSKTYIATLVLNVSSVRVCYLTFDDRRYVIGI